MHHNVTQHAADSTCCILVLSRGANMLISQQSLWMDLRMLYMSINGTEVYPLHWGWTCESLQQDSHSRYAINMSITSGNAVGTKASLPSIEHPSATYHRRSAQLYSTCFRAVSFSLLRPCNCRPEWSGVALGMTHKSINSSLWDERPAKASLSDVRGRRSELPTALLGQASDCPISSENTCFAPAAGIQLELHHTNAK